MFHENGNQKKAGIAILISDKIDFKIKTVTRDKEAYFIMMEGSFQEENTIIVNIYAPNIGAPQYIRQILIVIKGEIDSNTIIVGDSNTPLSSVDRSSRQKIKTQALNDSLDQMYLIGIYRASYPKAAFFSSAHETFSRTDHMLGHKASLGKFKKIEIISSIVSNHNATSLEINY